MISLLLKSNQQPKVILMRFGGSVLFVGVEVFFNLLDTLLMLKQNIIILTISYLQYINVQLPFNVQTYFELFGFAQFNFIQKFFDLSGFVDQILNVKQLKKIPKKVASDDITSQFIINSATITTVWFSLFCIYAFAKVIQQTRQNYYTNLNKLKSQFQQTIPKILYSFKFKFYSESEAENSWLVKVGVSIIYIYYKQSNYQYIINRLCFIIISQFFYSGILRAHMVTAFDLNFSVMLQSYANSPLIFIRLSSLLACVACALYIFSIYFVIKISQMKKYALNNQQIQTKYGYIFNGIKINQFSKYFNSILLIKKLIFMLFLIFAYEFPVFQTVSISILSILMSLFYILFQPLDDKLEYFKQLFSEVIVLLVLINQIQQNYNSISFTLITITLLASEIELAYFKYEIRQYFGWGCIFFMTSLLCIQLGIDGFQQWKFLFKKYKQIRKLAQSTLGLFQREKQVSPTSNIFQQQI